METFEALAGILRYSSEDLRVARFSQWESKRCQLLQFKSTILNHAAERSLHLTPCFRPCRRRSSRRQSLA